MSALNYARMKGPGDFTPDDPDDRWEAIAERLESEYATGDKLRDIAETEFDGFDIVPDMLAIYEGNEADFAVKAERLIRRLASRLSDAIEREAREDAIAEVARLDDEAEEARGEYLAWQREDAA